MKRGIFIAALFAALTAAASIVTVRNALFTWPPNYATFIGTESQPGIGSAWIPYGTYTHGVGTTEYARISAKLMGVVASAFDGRYERDYLTREDFDPTAAAFTEFKQTMLPCYTNFPGFSDAGAFLQSLTNNTARILDTINATAFVEVEHAEGSSTYSYFKQETGPIEALLASEEMADGNSWHWGVAKIYAGDALAAMCAAAQLNTEPPISTSWTNRLPFVAADSNAWVNIWPTYSALDNDAHIFPALTNATPKFGRYHLDNYYAPYSTPRFFEPAHLVEIWGGDVVGNETSGTARALELALESMPMDYTIEDVLSYNTGMSAGDYAHWRNGTARLDWKRLGIICQLVSQMDRTYLTRQDEDELPLYDNDVERIKHYGASMTVTLANVGGIPLETTTFYTPASWALVSNETVNTTNLVGWSYPTAAFHGANLWGGVGGTAATAFSGLYGSGQTIVDIAESVAQGVIGGLGDGQLIVELSGPVTAQGNFGLLWAWGTDFVDWFPTEGDMEPFYPTNSADVTFAPSGYPTEATVDLSLTIDKTATVKYTEASETMYTNYEARLTPYPLPQVWATNYVKRQRRPTLEVMLDTFGWEHLNVITNTAPLVWMGDADQKSARQFRMDKQVGDGAWATTRQASDRLRWRITDDLNTSVRSRFRFISGLDVDVAGRIFAEITLEDESAMQAKLSNKPAEIHTALHPIPRADRQVAVFVVVFQLTNGVLSGGLFGDAFWAWVDHAGEWHYDEITRSGNDFLLGEYGCVVDGLSTSAASTNAPARVDGHQDQMISTEWLPRNLRSVDD